MQQFFAAHRELFETVEMAAIAVETRRAAEDLLARLLGGEVLFPAAVPPNPQILPAPAAAGYLGFVTRADLPPELAEAAFAATDSEYLGPVYYDRRYWILNLLLPRRPEMNEAVYAYCEALMTAAPGARGGT